jgi:beta-phosphoglucomutase-like phosphatase (HAD superfamily)
VLGLHQWVRACLFDLDGVLTETAQRSPRSLRGAQLLDVSSNQAAVFEDAIAGVAAGRDGHFGVVIGVDRVGQAEALRRNGADTVVADLAELLDA